MGAGPSVQTRLDHVLAVAARVVEQHKRAPYSSNGTYFVPPNHAEDFWNSSRERSSAEIYRLRCIIHELHDLCRQIIAHTRSTQLVMGLAGSGADLSEAAVRAVVRETLSEKQRRRERRRRQSEVEYGGADGVYYGDSDSDMAPREITFVDDEFDDYDAPVRPQELLNGSVPLLSLTEQAAAQKRRHAAQERHALKAMRRSSPRRQHHRSQGANNNRHSRRTRKNGLSSRRKQELLLEYLEELEKRITDQERQRQRGATTASADEYHDLLAGTGIARDSPRRDTVRQRRSSREEPRSPRFEDDTKFAGSAVSPTLQAYRHTAALLRDRFAQSRRVPSYTPGGSTRANNAHTMSAYESYRAKYPSDKRGGNVAGAEGRWRDSLRSPRPQAIPPTAARPSPYPTFERSTQRPLHNPLRQQDLDVDDLYRTTSRQQASADETDRLGALQDTIAKLTRDISAIHAEHRDGTHRGTSSSSRLQELRELIQASSDSDDSADTSSTVENNGTANSQSRQSSNSTNAVTAPSARSAAVAVTAAAATAAAAAPQHDLAHQSQGLGQGLPEGTQVQANYGGKGAWYAGRITAANADGSYDIAYDDGDEERGVSPANVRPVPTADPERKPKADTAAAAAAAVAVAAAPAPAPSPAANEGTSSASFAVGAKVEANFGGKGKWYPGRVEAVNEALGTVDVLFDDGDRERGVTLRNVRSPASAAAERQQLTLPQFEAGDAVEGRFGGKDKWYPGEVLRVNNDGTVDILYSDGDKETSVAPHFVRSISSPGRAPASAESGSPKVNPDDGASRAGGPNEFNVNDAVEARYGGKDSWYRGRVEKVNSDGTFDIQYEDGDAEQNVRADLLRAVSSHVSKDEATSKSTSKAAAPEPTSSRSAAAESSTSTARGAFDVDDHVFCDRGGGDWAKGTVVAVLPADASSGVCTFNVLIDDAQKRGKLEPEVETDVPESRLRAAPPSDSDTDTDTTADAGAHSPAAFETGDLVEGNYAGKGTWYRGKIEAARRDGTYDIRYDDGDVERGVAEVRVRSVGGGETRGPIPLQDALETHANAPGICVGSKVEGNFGGTGQWYAGKVEAVHGNGTSFDLLYDDGDRERGVKPENVRLCGGTEASAATSVGSVSDSDDEVSTAGSSPKVASFSVGDVVEANYGGKGKWYPGKVSSANSNGTFDIGYDDGDSERGVTASRIRRAGGGGSFQEGDKVEGNFGGKGQWYPGVVEAVRGSNGTYDIRYDDGDSERGVSPDRLRRA